MREPPELDPDVDDEPPSSDTITPYDERRFVTYLRLLDAEAEGADWREVARIVLHRDPQRDLAGSLHCYNSHLARAHWMTESGYRQLLRGGGLRRTGACIDL